MPHWGMVTIVHMPLWGIGIIRLAKKFDSYPLGFSNVLSKKTNLLLHSQDEPRHSVIFLNHLSFQIEHGRSNRKL